MSRPTLTDAEAKDLELFTTPATDNTPDRHPSILRPGGHASPLKYPAALRPGAARQSRTPSPQPERPLRTSPAPSPHVQPLASPPAVAYKAYSPPRPSSPTDALSAEIEGYFTALEVAPLNITKASSPGPSSTADPIENRCASPPVPPKVRIEPEEDQNPTTPAPEHGDVDPNSAASENHENTESPADVVAEEDYVDEEPPPAYDAGEHHTPPPEKSARTPSADGRASGLAEAAAASAARVGSAVAAVDSDEARQNSQLNEAIAPSEPTTTTEALEEPTVDSPTDPGPPPPLPPRRKDINSSPSGKGKGKEPEASMPGAYPAPPSRPDARYKAGAAAPLSAAGVGAAVAGVGQSASLSQARRALEKRIGHLVDKAKEHHHQWEHQHQHGKKEEGKGEEGKGKEGESKKERKRRERSTSPVALVGGEEMVYGLRVEGEHLAV